MPSFVFVLKFLCFNDIIFVLSRLFSYITFKATVRVSFSLI